MKNENPQFDCYSTDDENFHSGCADEALQELYDQDRLSVGAIYSLGVSQRPGPDDFFSADTLIEQMQECARDNHGECAENYLADLSVAQVDELNALIKGWLKANAKVEFYAVRGIQQRTVTQEDVNAFSARAAVDAQQGEGAE
ncbi:hypothetical protein [Achromobacter kerstersii]|uniref:hypothetical protein n=1 Tax=Achromobacter kerstersii TaxID=1353890 RepID=UPI003208EC0A